MNILHISDIHFGPYHWAADDKIVLDRLNAFPADIVLNSGDMTSDSLQGEFEQAGAFLAGLVCENVVSILGNHDKYSKRSHEMFRTHIYDGPFIQPKDTSLVKKKKLYISPKTARLNDYFTDVNFLRLFEIGGEKVLIVGVDTNLFQSDSGYVDWQILAALGDEIDKLIYDRALLLAHHSVLSTDEDPLINSKRLTDFILAQNIEATFCGHTHEVDILQVTDVINGGIFRQFMCGSLSSVNIPRDKNMFCTYENFGTSNEKITVTRIIPTADGIGFIETHLGE
ncbi:MAG: metallophosphoesterase [Alphaproteobacteria bacterium]|nr:metallophosphoesterase [Alphaproteobacteria bacterium]